jgi:hypothetical protein
MACTIEATPGHASANSYATIAEGNTYHENHLYASSWDDADDDTKCRALVMATRLLDTWFEWTTGLPASGTQALLWPRDAAYGPNGYEHDDDEIPVLVKEATIEWARHLIAGDRTADSDIETQGISALKAGSVFLQFRSGVSAKPVPDAVQAKASHYGRMRGRGGGAVTVLRG